ncbi:MAG: hypothetical protein K2Q03_10080, partial [Sphingobacteriaceae bacterium]|nr:hypothetical protein [Sphingobacteriaceae bacterium]
PVTGILGEIDDSETLLSLYEKELIQLFFSDTLKSGMTKDKVLKILKKYYPIDSLLKKKTTVIYNPSQSKKNDIKK